MTPGKAASQAGHAFLSSYNTAPVDIQKAYVGDGGGTKVVLSAPDKEALCDLYHAASQEGVPCFLWVESDHIMPPAFDGSPIITAVGIGPVERCKVKHLTRGFSLMK